MSQFGSFALLFALALGVYSFAIGGLALFHLSRGANPRASRLLETSRRAGIGIWPAITCAAFALVWAAFTNDFSVEYIREHSNIALATPYKFAVLWSGQEGSLLFWVWLLSTYGFVLRLRHKVDQRLYAYASVILSAVQIFFLLLVNFAAHPFALATQQVADGNGLNPLLQYPEMVIHPPMLYLGYVGFSVPFAFALGALIMRYPGEKWINITRRWTMVTWLFLTCGIFLGAHWAYSVLGWGGYWGWDPVENASLMPWLTGTAFLHSVMMQEKRGMMKSWNMWLIFVTFLMSLLGTFLTRSGVVSSVHAFAQSAIGDWFVWFMGLTLAICLFVYLKNRDHLQAENKMESIVSREASFLFNNIVLLASCFTVLWGTLFPILSEYVQGHKVTVGAPFYNRVNLPIGIFLLFLTGIGPLLAWRSTSFQSIKRNFRMPTLLAVVAAVGLIAGGVRPWSDTATLFSVMTLSLAIFVAATVTSEFVRGGRVIAQKTGKSLGSAMVQLTLRNTRRYGGYLVHMGVVLIVIGFAGNAFNQQQELEMGTGDKMQIGAYTLVNRQYSQDDNPNYETEYAMLDVYKGGKLIAQMNPEKRFYKASQQPSTMVANHSTLKEDLYVIYAGKNMDTDRPIIKVFVNPLVAWIWIGVLVIVAGTGVALLPNIAAATLTATKPVRAAVPQQAGATAGD
jgi:cytochrome c-type biogenesis protein CcmF